MGEIKSKKLSNWLSWIGRNKGDVYIFLDTRLSKQSENFLKSRWKGEIYFNSYTSNARGTAVFVRKNFSITNCKFDVIDPGNFSTFHFDYNKNKYALNVLFCPNVDSPSYYKDVIF